MRLKKSNTGKIGSKERKTKGKKDKTHKTEKGSRIGWKGDTVLCVYSSLFACKKQRKINNPHMVVKHAAYMHVNTFSVRDSSLVLAFLIAYFTYEGRAEMTPALSPQPDELQWTCCLYFL